MRFLLFTLIFCLLSSAAFAQGKPDTPTALAWDRCVGENAQDYADMFGAVSMRDGEDIDKAVEDCWDYEYEFSQNLKASQPRLSDNTIDGLVHERKMQIRNKWEAFYAKGARGNFVSW